MSSARPKIVVAEAYPEAALERMRAVADVVVPESGNRDALLAALGDAQGLLVRTYTRVDAELFNAAPRLRLIGRAGVGLDNIDTISAESRGIKVVHTPDASTVAVAELTLGLMIALERHVAVGHSAVEAGQFHEARSRLVGRELRGLTLGIIGLGRIGKAVARMAYHGLGMRIIYNDIAEMGWLDFVAAPMAKADLYGQADVISLHVPLTPDTRHLISAEVLAALKLKCTLINTSRGQVVDCLALANSLQSKQIAGAALDVYEPEPLPMDHPLRRCERLILTPHLASRTHESLVRMESVVDEVINILAR